MSGNAEAIPKREALYGQYIGPGEVKRTCLVLTATAGPVVLAMLLGGLQEEAPGQPFPLDWFLAGLFILAVLAVVLLVARRGYSGPALTVDDSGVTLTRGMDTIEAFPWESVRRVDLTETGAVVWTDRGEFFVSAQMNNWRPLVAYLRSIATEQQDGEDTAADADTVRGWLGLAPGERLRATARDDGDVVGAMLGGSSGWQVDERGLSRFGRRPGYWDWNELVALREEVDCWVITTAGEELVLPKYALDHAEPLVAAIERVLDARRQGYVLPDADERAERGLSRARMTAEEEAERGISRSET